MRKTKTLLALLTILATLGVVQARKNDAVIWTDYDFKNIPEPKVRDVGYYDYFFKTEFIEPVKRGTDIPRWIRHAVGSPRQASNVNALDEVPDSSWFTNRHALRRMTIEQLVKGPNQGNPPDFVNAVITRAKLEGVTPGLQLTDATGQSYLIKFDNKDYPELQSGAEVISTKILYASGYNVPENYIAYIDPETLTIKPGVEIHEGKKTHAMTREDLARILQNAARRPDGRYRVLASKILKGSPKGPFAYVGLRSDDPNDLIPHEHRRELRGLRVIASWINHWDLKEMNTLDMYVDENGRKFLRHYFIDFGSSLGGGRFPMEYSRGREYVFDVGNMMKELFTLGFAVTPEEKTAALVSPEMGIFSASDFDPGGWKTSFQMAPFENMTQRDAAWGTRIILSFSEDELRNIIGAAEYSNPKAAEYLLRTLLERRQQIASHWLKDASPLANFAVAKSANGIELGFEDLLATQDLAAARAEYRYEFSSNGHWSESMTTAVPKIALGDAPGASTDIRIWCVRDRKASRPVLVSIRSKSGGYGIARIDRS